MNISCSIRRSTLERLLTSVIEASIRTPLNEVAAPAAFGFADDATIVHIMLQNVSFVEDSPFTTLAVNTSVPVSQQIAMVVNLVIYVSDDASVIGVGTGGIPRLAPIIVGVPYLATVRQPVPMDPIAVQSPSSLLLEIKRVVGSGTLTRPDGVPVNWMQAFEGGRDPAWLTRISTMFEWVEVGALLPPISVARLTAAGLLVLGVRAARLIGDELRFGLLPMSLVLPRDRVDSIVAEFREQPVRLTPDEDCVVEVGEAASILFWGIVTTAVGRAISALATAGPLPLPGGLSAQLTPRFMGVPPSTYRSTRSYRTDFPLRTTGLCGVDDIRFLTQGVDIDMGLDAAVSLQVAASTAAPTVALLDYNVTVDADLNQGHASECAALLSAPTLGLYGAIWAIAARAADDQLEANIAGLVVINPAFPALLSQFGASAVYEFNAESFSVRVPITSNFGLFGVFRLDPQSIQTTRRGNALRVAGRFPPLDQRASGSPLDDRLEVRDLVEYFTIQFSGSLTGGVDCSERAPSAIGFTLWNRSPRPVSIYEFDIRSPDWQRLLRSGDIQWEPSVDSTRPIVIAPGGTARVRLRFSSIEALGGAVRLSMDAGAYQDLVMYLRSTQFPVVIRWSDPLARLRAMTPADIERAREVCRLGPVVSPWEIHRRPREFDLFPEVQPFWQQDDPARLLPSGVRAETVAEVLPWEPASLTSAALHEPGRGVFSVLLQSMKQRS
jgi:hypothetical protein